LHVSQAGTVILPGLTNIWISVLKDTALVALAGLNALFCIKPVQSVRNEVAEMVIAHKRPGIEAVYGRALPLWLRRIPPVIPPVFGPSPRRNRPLSHWNRWSE
jgi:hypothetical protein